MVFRDACPTIDRFMHESICISDVRANVANFLLFKPTATVLELTDLYQMRANFVSILSYPAQVVSGFQSCFRVFNDQVINHGLSEAVDKFFLV